MAYSNLSQAKAQQASDISTSLNSMSSDLNKLLATLRKEIQAQGDKADKEMVAQRNALLSMMGFRSKLSKQDITEVELDKIVQSVQRAFETGIFKKVGSDKVVRRVVGNSDKPTTLPLTQPHKPTSYTSDDLSDNGSDSETDRRIRQHEEQADDERNDKLIAALHTAAEVGAEKTGDVVGAGMKVGLIGAFGPAAPAVALLDDLVDIEGTSKKSIRWLTDFLTKTREQDDRLGLTGRKHKRLEDKDRKDQEDFFDSTDVYYKSAKGFFGSTFEKATETVRSAIASANALLVEPVKDILTTDLTAAATAKKAQKSAQDDALENLLQQKAQVKLAKIQADREEQRAQLEQYHRSKLEEIMLKQLNGQLTLAEAAKQTSAWQQSFTNELQEQNAGYAKQVADLGREIKEDRKSAVQQLRAERSSTYRAFKTLDGFIPSLKSMFLDRAKREDEQGAERKEESIQLRDLLKSAVFSKKEDGKGLFGGLGASLASIFGGKGSFLGGLGGLFTKTFGKGGALVASLGAVLSAVYAGKNVIDDVKAIFDSSKSGVDRAEGGAKAIVTGALGTIGGLVGGAKGAAFGAAAGAFLANRAEALGKKIGTSDTLARIVDKTSETARKTKDFAVSAGESLKVGVKTVGKEVGSRAYGLLNPGALSEKYESGGGHTAIGYDKLGGTSYGSYQIASKTGMMDKFVDYLNSSGHKDWAASLASSGPFNTGSTKGRAADVWRSLTNKHGREFTDAQRKFIEQTSFNPLLDKLKDSTGLDVNAHSNALRNVLWSMSVQHSGAGVQRIVKSALKDAGSDASDQKLIEAIYKARGSYVDNLADKDTSNGDVKSADLLHSIVTHRYKSEKADALAMLAQETGQPVQATAGSQAIAKATGIPVPQVSERATLPNMSPTINIEQPSVAETAPPRGANVMTAMSDIPFYLDDLGIMMVLGGHTA